MDSSAEQDTGARDRRAGRPIEPALPP